MKTMTCKQLGGVCDQSFTGTTFDEIAALSKKHGMEMFQKGDAPHLQAMNKMQKLMTSPTSMNQWMESKRKEFESLPKDRSL